MNIRDIVNITGLFSYIFSRIGCLALMIMMCLTVVDVVGRYVFSAPILGAFELISFLVSIMIFSFLGYAQSQNAHVTVDILVNTFPRKAQSVVDLFNSAIGLIMMVLISWKGFEKAFESLESGDKPMNLPIPDYPFVYFMALGCAILCIEFIRDILRTYSKNLSHKD